MSWRVNGEELLGCWYVREIRLKLRSKILSRDGSGTASNLDGYHSRHPLLTLVYGRIRETKILTSMLTFCAYHLTSLVEPCIIGMNIRLETS
jgi:hypothetical protein